jgi:hypothetical protein
MERDPVEERRTAAARTETAGTAGTGRASRMRVPRTRGALSGLLLVLLGVWAGLIPFVGPYFNYEFASDETWLITWDRFWLCVLPAACIFLGGLLVLGSRHRVGGGFGAWLALAGGIWFAVGPATSMLWDSSLGPSAPIGAPVGSNGVQFLEYLGFFYGVGALGTALAAFALGRFSVVGVRDVEYATGTTAAATAPATAEERPGDRPAYDDDGRSRPPLRRRIFSRRR